MKPGIREAPNTQFFRKKTFSASNDTVIRRMGAGAVMVSCHGACIMIGPMLKDAGMPMLIDFPVTVEQVPYLDGILVTHIDRDHYSLPTYLAVHDRREGFHTTQYVAPEMQGNGINGIRHDISRQFTIGSIHIPVTPADHCWQNQDKRYEDKQLYVPEDYCGFYIDMPNGTFWDIGGSKLVDEQLHLPKLDVILFGFSNNEWHIILGGAYKLTAAYPGSELVLIHWGLVNRPDITACNASPIDLLGNIVNPGRIRIAVPGEPVKLKRINKRWGIAAAYGRVLCGGKQKTNTPAVCITYPSNPRQGFYECAPGIYGELWSPL